ncbi:Tripartite tricarboxylate transporter TctA family protein [Halomonas sp. THAF12]|uniref:tripartite tricarboxylate transporter permease n=1 Tax=Halomonas TaxID=2745 RepID=UPI0002DEB331|nr:MULTISPECIES: tripartite tricarboxylate transporter permease [Halomonas]QFT83775.1 Tripartite tricarboxylate transporter TctA family protein [Halomonas sp. THAF12]
MTELLQATAMVFQWEVILVIVAASLFGLFMGAIPGLTATMATALLVPVTFFMDPLPAIAAIVSATAMAIVAGDIPGALLRMPGTPASAVYADEAFLMGKRGQLGLALGINVTCSMLGGVIGVAVLALFAPRIAEFALEFTSDEYFWLALLGLSCAILVAGGDPLKGAISMLIGLAIAMVGMDSVSGQVRFTLGNYNLLAGISLLPVLIGLFAITELLRSLPTAGRGASRKETPRREGFGGVAGTTWRYKGGVARGGLLGTMIGALPGAGADIASWISYAISRKLSREPQKYGTGHPEGLVSASAANNAALSGAYIPALVFGIPGDTVTAIIIGVLTTKGITPGPDVFTEQGALVNAIFLVFVLANLLLLPLGFMAIKGAGRLLSVPTGVLYPLILMFCIVGAFSANNSMFDVWVMLGLGLVGVFLMENDFPLGPLILAFILGPIIESNFMRSILKSDGDLTAFVDRPIAMVLAGLAILVWTLIIANGVWKRPGRRASASETAAEA